MKIKFMPQNVECDVDPSKTLLQQARENGLKIKSICNGVPSCAECRVKIVAGDNSIPEPGKAELGLIGTSYFLDGRRLSCQVRCFGPVTVDLTEQVNKVDTQKKVRGFRQKDQKEVSAVQDTMILNKVEVAANEAKSDASAEPRGESRQENHQEARQESRQDSQPSQRQERPPQQKQENRQGQNQRQGQKNDQRGDQRNQNRNQNRQQQAKSDRPGGGQRQDNRQENKQDGRPNNRPHPRNENRPPQKQAQSKPAPKPVDPNKQ